MPLGGLGNEQHMRLDSRLWKVLAQPCVLAAAALELVFLLFGLVSPDLESRETTAGPTRLVVAHAVYLAHVAFLVVAGGGRGAGRLLPLALAVFGLVIARWMWFIFYVAERDASIAWAARVALLTAPIMLAPTVVASVLLVLARVPRVEVGA